MNSIENFNSTNEFFIIGKILLACAYSSIVLLVIYVLFTKLKLFYIKEVTLALYLVLICAICK